MFYRMNNQKLVSPDKVEIGPNLNDLRKFVTDG